MGGPVPAEGKGAMWGVCHAPRAHCLQDHSPLPAHLSALLSGMGQGEQDTVLWHPPRSHISLYPQGRDCEVALSGCSSNPCANGGTCQPQEGEGLGFR